MNPEDGFCRQIWNVRLVAMETSQRWDTCARMSNGHYFAILIFDWGIAGCERLDRPCDWLVLGAIGGFILGAGAAWVQRLDLPLSHGLVTAVGTYSAAQMIFIVVRLVSGNRSTVEVTNPSVVGGAGLIGGWIGRRLRAKGFVPSFERSS